MYIHDLKCDWLNHPFVLNSFKIKTDTEIRKIIAAGITLVEIDTGKGLDLLVEKPSVEKSQLTKVVDNSLKKFTAREEMGKAKVAFSMAGEFITEMMSNAKMGQHIELEQVNPVINKLSQSILRNTLREVW